MDWIIFSYITVFIAVIVIAILDQIVRHFRRANGHYWQRDQERIDAFFTDIWLVNNWERLTRQYKNSPGNFGSGRFRQYLDGDGELSDQLVALLNEPSTKEKRSLDDLLW